MDPHRKKSRVVRGVTGRPGNWKPMQVKAAPWERHLLAAR
jgi:hypothetical protein